MARLPPVERRRGPAALVIGSDTRSFLAVIRSLGRAGIAVDVAGAPAGTPALRSRYIRAMHGVRGHDVAALREIARRTAIDLVIPCDDHSIVPIQEARASFDGIPLALPDYDAYLTCADKARTHALASACGVPVPEQRVVTTAAELDETAAAFGWPLVIKPRRSVSPGIPEMRHPVRKARRASDLRDVEYPVLVQQNVNGIGIGVEVLCAEGELLLAFQHERLHEPPGGGGSSYRRSVPLTPSLYSAAERLMRALRYTGVAMIEFRVDRATGRWVLIEINGRFWGSLPLSIAAGADFPRYLFELLVTGRRQFPQSYRSGIYARDWAIDLRWFVRNLLTDRRDPTLQTRPLVTSVLDFVRHLPAQRSDTLTRDDPAPAWGELAQAVRESTAPLRDRGAATRALHRARRILFVCKGNICRSPFAACYLRARTGGTVAVESAGYHPVAERQAPAAAVAAARALGVDLTAHRSQVLTVDQVARADVIFVFDRENAREVLGWFPIAQPKLHYLGPLAGRCWFRDPMGASVERYLDTYRGIGRAVDAIVPRLPVTEERVTCI